MNILTLITARAGSKGLPGKNTKHINGEPLIYWSIKAGKESKYVNDIYVSTDCEKIASISEHYGAKVPFLRPADLASDTASSSDVIIHFINEMETRGQRFSHILLLEPTSPLREAQDIDNAVEQLLDTPSATSLVSVGLLESHHPDFTATLDGDKFIRLKSPLVTARRQDLSPLYFFDGSIYISAIETFKQRRTFYHDHTLGYIVPKWKTHEIDDMVDFIIVEALMKNFKQ